MGEVERGLIAHRVIADQLDFEGQSMHRQASKPPASLIPLFLIEHNPVASPLVFPETELFHEPNFDTALLDSPIFPETALFDTPAFLLD